MEDGLSRSHDAAQTHAFAVSLRCVFFSLKERSRSAKSRIALSTLYLGDGSLERGLVDSIDYNLRRNENLHVTVLLDYLRGTRGVAQEKSSTTLLKAIADRAAVYLYHTPKLTGLVKRLLPERTNEIVGLQHMKLYIFDDSVLISGANLSDSYFVDRQDRYVLFENCKDLADFFCNIINALGESSFLLNSDGSIKLHPNCSVHPYEGSFFEYRDLLRSRIAKVIDTLQTQQASAQRSSSDTLLYPLVQMGLFGYHEEYELLKRLLSSKDNTTSITMASGYFNCIKEYEQLIFSEGKYSMDIVTAAPKANGFFGAAGPSGYVPSMYSWVCERILRMKEKYARDDVNLYEYHRDGWTFHAKGLWVDTPEQTATLVGSSNFEEWFKKPDFCEKGIDQCIVISKRKFCLLRPTSGCVANLKMKGDVFSTLPHYWMGWHCGEQTTISQW
ncbi:hypothetical protein Y032_0363g3535 [Ancylostoma ceylanicum]|uniref:CDP-diacylglycerol--glycerol-3-phosphate 3-phosphatidyltransferase n=1 Tax=Ancylostoma ceylanicum TaxID=53326 RepID=A0A016RVY8_9BILA|nr:hypothetical protein Y032_0363g3535 [Ancylostoma ceylanicum]